MPAAEPLIAELTRRYPGRVSTSALDRDSYGRDLWPRGLLAVQAGASASRPPDAIVWPTSTAEVAEIVRLAARAKVAIVPFGAGSGVCGGAIPLAGGITIDLKRMRRLLAFDREDGTATFECGIIGEHLEHELVRRRATLGHFPSSIMCSTLGGWLAARSAGQFSTKYGKIEDLVQSITLVDGTGAIHQLPAGGAPDLCQLIVGSEGTLGVITEAKLAISPAPESQIYGGWSFPRLSAGLEAMRRVLQRNLRPACLRLYDELDSFFHRSEKDSDEHDSQASPEDGFVDLLKRRVLGAALGRPHLINRAAATLLPLLPGHGGCLLVAGFEGEHGLTEAEHQSARIELLRAGGKELGPGPGQRWLRHRYAVSFRMSKIFDAGGFVDTMEVATTWDRLTDLYQAVRRAISPVAFIMAHFSHGYPDGCSIYFTFAGPGAATRVEGSGRTTKRPGGRWEAERLYDEIWRRGLSAANAAGATISHHHGVGLAKAPFMPAEHGAAMSVYRALKTVVDPEGISNPGKMGL